MKCMSFLILSILLLTQISCNSDAIDDSENIIYDDFYSNLQKNSLNAKVQIDNKPIIASITDLDSYFSQNSYLFKTNKIQNQSPGECINKFRASEDIDYISDTNQSYLQNISFLEKLVDSRNVFKIFNDSNGNFLIASISVSTQIRTKFIFVSKSDFSFYIFSQQGDEIPILKDFIIGHIFVKSQNKHVIYIFGGIDYKGSHSNDLFSIEVDYNKQSANIKTFLSKNNKGKNAPAGMTEGSFTLFTLNTSNNSNSKREKVVGLLYGGQTDSFLSNDVFIFSPDKGWTKIENLELNKVKGHEAVKIEETNSLSKYNDNSEVVKKLTIVVFGGRNEKTYYENNFLRLEVTYVALDDSFFIKPVYLNISNSSDVIGREGHALLFDYNLFLSDGITRKVYLLGGRNFVSNKHFNSEIFELDLSNDVLQWNRIPVKSQQSGLVTGNAVAFYYDGFINLDLDTYIRIIIRNLPCDNSLCKRINLKSKILTQPIFEQENSNKEYRNVECLNLFTKRVSDAVFKTKVNDSTNSNKDKSKAKISIKKETLEEEPVFIQKGEVEKIKENSSQDINTNDDSLNSSSDPDMTHQNYYNEYEDSDVALYNSHKKKKKKTSLAKHLTNLLNNSTHFEQELFKTFNESHNGLVTKVDKVSHDEEMRFVQLKEVQANLMNSIIENQKFATEQLLNKTSAKNEKEIENLNQKIQEVLMKSENEIEAKTSSKIEKLMQRLETLEKKSSSQLENITNNQIEQLNFVKEELNLRKKQAKCLNGFLTGGSFCTCYPGFTGSDCSEIVLCPNQCSQQGECKFGTCYCYPGFSGDGCQTKQSCLNDCNQNGVCSFGKCFCDAGYDGNDCSNKLSCPLDCSSKGLCFRGSCLCESGYYGESCERISVNYTPCKNNCNGNGICDLGKCFCYKGYNGEFCDIKQEFTCPPYSSNSTLSTSDISNNGQSSSFKLSKRKSKASKIKSYSKFSLTFKYLPCNGNGICQYGICTCYPGFKGDDCSQNFVCNNDCNLNGICVADGVCKCKDGYTGDLCDINLQLQLKQNSNSNTNRKAGLSNLLDKPQSSFIQLDSLNYDFNIFSKNSNTSINDREENGSQLGKSILQSKYYQNCILILMIAFSISFIVLGLICLFHKKKH